MGNFQDMLNKPTKKEILEEFDFIYQQIIQPYSYKIQKHSNISITNTRLLLFAFCTCLFYENFIKIQLQFAKYMVGQESKQLPIKYLTVKVQIIQTSETTVEIIKV